MRLINQRWFALGSVFAAALLCLPAQGAFAQPSVPAAASATATAPVTPLHPATLAQVEKIMALIHAGDRAKSAMANAIEIQRKQAPALFPDAFWSEVSAEMQQIDWVKVSVPVFQKYLSEDEANAAIAFYSTPLGQKLLESTQAMTEELQAQGFTLGKEIGTRVALKYQKEIEENVKKMQQQQTAPPQ